MTYRRTLRALGLGALTVLLSACIKLDMDVAIHSNDTVSGSIITGVSKEAIQLFPGGETELRNQIREGLQQEDVPDGVTVKDYTDDRFVGVTLGFEDVTLEEFAGTTEGQTGDLQISHEGDRFILNATLPLTGEGLGAGDLGAFAGTGEIRVAVTFPGRVLSHNGQLDGTTVSWTGTLGQDLVMRAESEDSGAESVAGGDGGSTWLWIALGVLVVAGLVGFFLYRRSRTAAPAAAAAGSHDTTGTIADYDQPVAGQPYAQPAPPDSWAAPSAPEQAAPGAPQYGTPATPGYGALPSAPDQDTPTQPQYGIPAEPPAPLAAPPGGSPEAAEDSGDPDSETSTTSVLDDLDETDTPPAGQPPASGPKDGSPRND